MIGNAFAQAAGSAQGGDTMMGMLPIILMFVILYFLMIRPQQKQKKDREAMLSTVKKGDRVVTTGGLHGTVVGLNEQTVTLKVADSVKLDFDRTALGRIVTAPGSKEAGH